MSCDICGRHDCKRSFHSIQMQQAYDDAINSDKSNLLSEIAALREQLAASRQEVEVQKAKADKHYELGTEYFDLMVKAEREIATLRDALSRLVEVHDEMGGVCGTVRIAAEEALAGKAQSEYICTCGIRVTPHRCPTDSDF